MAQIPSDIQRLIDTYIKAQENLVKIIAEKEAKGSMATYQKSLLIQVMQILQNLDDEAKKWSEDSISNYYQQGINDAVQGLKSLGQDVGLNPMVSPIHQGAINAIVNSCYGDLHDANNFVGRRIKDVIRQAGIDAVANKLATGQTIQECKKNIINSLIDEGINGIKDKRGRNISLDAYASTVARSTTREATNTATQNQLTELGYDLVKMSSHLTTCPICAMYQGRVYSISGKTPGYPPLSIAFSGGYANIHPNCRHVIFPYIRALDDNADKLQEDSNRPFEVTERDKKSINDYNKQQKEKRQLRSDRQQYQRYKLALPDDTPKSFANFRQMKQSNSEKWVQLESGYKSITAKGVSQAKSRNKKIDITDIAIDKVSNIEIPGFTQEQNLMVQQKHKELLKISKDENNCNEVLNICTINFNKDAITLGEETGVNPNKNPEAVSVMRLAEENSIIWMHNHPKGSTFSLGDIITFISDQRINTITVVSNAGKVYSLSKTMSFDYSFVRDKMIEMKDRYDLDKKDDEIHNEIVEELLKFLNKNGAIYKKR